MNTRPAACRSCRSPYLYSTESPACSHRPRRRMNLWTYSRGRRTARTDQALIARWLAAAEANSYDNRFDTVTKQKELGELASHSKSLSPAQARSANIANPNGTSCRRVLPPPFALPALFVFSSAIARASHPMVQSPSRGMAAAAKRSGRTDAKSLLAIERRLAESPRSIR